jgi:hypothetical protein
LNIQNGRQSAIFDPITKSMTPDERVHLGENVDDGRTNMSKYSQTCVNPFNTGELADATH